MSQNTDMAEFARNLWENYIRQKVEEAVSGKVGYYKAAVTQNPGDGTLKVQQPFGTEHTVMCTDSLSGAAVGSNVIVMVLGNGENAQNRISVSLYGMRDISTMDEDGVAGIVDGLGTLRKVDAIADMDSFYGPGYATTSASTLNLPTTTQYSGLAVALRPYAASVASVQFWTIAVRNSYTLYMRKRSGSTWGSWKICTFTNF